MHSGQNSTIKGLFDYNSWDAGATRPAKGLNLRCYQPSTEVLNNIEKQKSSFQLQKTYLCRFHTN